MKDRRTQTPERRTVDRRSGADTRPNNEKGIVGDRRSGVDRRSGKERRGS